MYYNYDITHILSIYKLILSNISNMIYKEITNKILFNAIIAINIIVIYICIFRNKKQLLNKIYTLDDLLQKEKDIEGKIKEYEKTMQKNEMIKLITNKNIDLERRFIENDTISLNKVEKLKEDFNHHLNDYSSYVEKSDKFGYGVLNKIEDLSINIEEKLEKIDQYVKIENSKHSEVSKKLEYKIMDKITNLQDHSDTSDIIIKKFEQYCTNNDIKMKSLYDDIFLRLTDDNSPLPLCDIPVRFTIKFSKNFITNPNPIAELIKKSIKNISNSGAIVFDDKIILNYYDKKKDDKKIIRDKIIYDYLKNINKIWGDFYLRKIKKIQIYQLDGSDSKYSSRITILKQ